MLIEETDGTTYHVNPYNLQQVEWLESGNCWVMRYLLGGQVFVHRVNDETAMKIVEFFTRLENPLYIVPASEVPHAPGPNQPYIQYTNFHGMERQ